MRAFVGRAITVIFFIMASHLSTLANATELRAVAQCYYLTERISTTEELTTNGDAASATCGGVMENSYASATPTSLHGSVFASENIENYTGAHAFLKDTITANPENAGLIGTNGTLRFEATLSGRLYNSILSFTAWAMVYDPISEGFYYSKLLKYSDAGNPLERVFNGPPVIRVKDVLVDLEWTVPITYGVEVSYGADLGLDVNSLTAGWFVDGQYQEIDFGGYADFTHSLTFQRVRAYDVHGDETSASIINGTGFDLSKLAAPVPEPETYALMLAGLGLVGFAARYQKVG